MKQKELEPTGRTAGRPALIKVSPRQLKGLGSSRNSVAVASTSFVPLIFSFISLSLSLSLSRGLSHCLTCNQQQGLGSNRDRRVPLFTVVYYCFVFYFFVHFHRLAGCLVVSGFFLLFFLSFRPSCIFFLSTTKSAGQVFRFFDFCYDNVIVMNMAIESKVSLVI